MTDYEIVDQYENGHELFAKLVSRMNIRVSYSTFGTPNGVIKQLNQSQHRNLLVFYMTEVQDDTQPFGYRIQIEKTLFSKKS